MTHLIRKLVYFSPFLFPAYLLRFQVLGVPFTVLEVYTYVLFVLWVVDFVRRRSFFWKKPLPPYFIGAVLLFLGASLGTLAAPAFIEMGDEVIHAQLISLGIWKGWVVAPLLYFVVLTQILNSQAHIQKLLRMFVYSGTAIALLAYIFVVFGGGMTYDARLSGFYESANQLALYLLPAVVLNTVWVIQRPLPTRAQRYVDIASLTIMAHALFFTQSYAAIIALFGTLVFYSLYVMTQRKNRSRKTFLGLLTLLAIFAIIAFAQINTPKFRQFIDIENQSSTSVRFEIYKTTWQVIKENPLLGVGPGLFQTHYRLQAEQTLGHPPMEWNVPHPHNIFFAFWLESGLLGLIAFLWICVLAHRRFTYPLLALWAIILHGFFDTPFWKNDLAMIFWLVIAAILLLQIYGVNSPKNRSAGARMRPRGRLGARPGLRRRARS